jgi:uncharacterized membrane protein
LIAERPQNFQRCRTILRALAAVGFILAGANHFRNPDFYREIVPPKFGPPAALVAISGICEIAGGVGLLIPRLRRFAGLGLIALLIAVFPANIYMAVTPERMPDMHFPRWMLWLRLPFQVVFIVWIWFVGLWRESTKTQVLNNKNI